ncbi:MAG: serpin family protein [bacterium]|nr:serpin family protein [bacterium]
MSTTQVLLPIVGAIEAANQLLGGNRRWDPRGPDRQRHFLKNVYEPMRLIVGEIPDIESIAARSTEEINAFLRRKGFSIALDPFTDPRDFGVASVLDVLVEWLERGDIRSIRTGGREYPAVRIPVKDRYAPARSQRVLFFANRAFPNPVACLQTRSPAGDVVYLTVLDASRVPDLLASPGPLLDLTISMATPDYGGVVFPMVSLDHEVDISWLRGLETTGVDGLPAIIGQALQQTKFRMNEVGARAESAVALRVTRGMAPRPKPDLIIDQPFCCWIERPGFPFPLFFGHITEDDWRNPGTLGR